jgi:hypothetical protein
MSAPCTKQLLHASSDYASWNCAPWAYFMVKAAWSKFWETSPKLYVCICILFLGPAITNRSFDHRLNNISISRRSGIQPAAYRALKGAKLRLHSAWKRRYLTSRGFPHDGNRNVICAPTLSFAHMYSMKEDYAPKSRKLAADGRKFAEDRSCM